MNLTSLKFASVLLLLATLTLASAKDEATLSTMRDLVKERQWKELIEQFKNEDLAAWKDASPETVAAAAAAQAIGGPFRFITVDKVFDDLGVDRLW